MLFRILICPPVKPVLVSAALRLCLFIAAASGCLARHSRIYSRYFSLLAVRYALLYSLISGRCATLFSLTQTLQVLFGYRSSVCPFLQGLMGCSGFITICEALDRISESLGCIRDLFVLDRPAVAASDLSSVDEHPHVFHQEFD